MTPVASDPAHRALRPVAWWLVACAAMVFVMVILGGATRLTGSGLSMVEWQPLHILPPLTDAQWQAEFSHYQQFPEFAKKNAWMALADFKSIYRLEYLHRLWGRLIGFAFAVPFLWFLIRRKIDRSLAWKLAGLLVLGALQGGLGWFMVASGLVDRPSVSQYRLAAHLVTAFVLYGAILWVALDLSRQARSKDDSETSDRATAGLAATVAIAVLLVVVSGALVAGLHAGLIDNTFPLMEGKVVPDGIGDLTPWYLNPFENVITVQFDHRILALTLVASIAALWWRSRLTDLTRRGRRLVTGLVTMAALQAALGISTLLLVVPLPVALAHQSGALLLFTFAVCVAHELRATVPMASPAPAALPAATAAE